MCEEDSLIKGSLSVLERKNSVACYYQRSLAYTVCKRTNTPKIRIVASMLQNFEPLFFQMSEVTSDRLKVTS